jgi:tyrosyl-tRNA synthetase
MSEMSTDDALARLLAGCEHVYTEAELKARLESGRPMRVKLGMDPSAPDLHLGHSVVLRKLRAFQDLGHTAVLIIGDYTARIGDPSGRSKTRPVLTPRQVDANAETYFQQAEKILDVSPDKLEIRRNSEWLGGMNFGDVLRLAGKMTVARMLERDTFASRFKAGVEIYIHEFLYPLMQGQDSVAIHSDVELGGTDQTFNNLVGRELQRDAGQPPQIVMILPILPGLDGKEKMSKSLDNYIAVTDSPRDMFGKTMSIPDGLMGVWFELLTNLSDEQRQDLLAGHPMEAKKRLAMEVGRAYHSAEAMDQACRWWHERFAERTRDFVDIPIPADALTDGALAAWRLFQLAHGKFQMAQEWIISNSEAKRQVQGGAFEYAGEKITDPQHLIRPTNGDQFRAGRWRHGERIKQPLHAVVQLM